jgi:hypothetical protein
VKDFAALTTVPELEAVLDEIRVELSKAADNEFLAREQLDQLKREDIQHKAKLHESGISVRKARQNRMDLRDKMFAIKDKLGRAHQEGRY